MHEPLKLIIAGPVGAGKTTFIYNLSEIETVNTDVLASEDLGKAYTTVAMDYGILTLDNIPLHLYGTPGQDRFDFMWEVLCEGALGLILLIAGNDPATFSQARNILEFITSRINVPFVLGVTRGDLPESWEAADVSDYFDLPSQQALSLNATEKDGCLEAVKHLLQLAGSE
jgi:uncharacterized protein